MKKYYIEIADMDNPCEYMFQSEWFDTEKQALNWAKKIDFLSKQYSISLMTSEWNTILDTYIDIEFVRYLDIELHL